MLGSEQMNTCEICGANLDPQEKCECLNKREDEQNDIHTIDTSAKAVTGSNAPVRGDDTDDIINQLRALRESLI